MSEPILSARSSAAGSSSSTTNGEGTGVAVVQMDGKDRRQVGGFDLTAKEFPIFAA
jgi:hypothetical protein